MDEAGIVPMWCARTPGGSEAPVIRRNILKYNGAPREVPPKCNVDTYDEVGWFQPPKTSKDMSTEKPIKRALRNRGEEIFRHYNPLARRKFGSAGLRLLVSACHVLCTRTVLLAVGKGWEIWSCSSTACLFADLSLFVVAQADLRPERRRHGHAWMRWNQPTSS